MGFEKVPYNPRTLEGHWHWAVHMLRKYPRRPKLSPLADLEAQYKQEVKAKAGLPTTRVRVQGMPRHAHRAPLARTERPIGTRHGIQRNLHQSPSRGFSATYNRENRLKN